MGVQVNGGLSGDPIGCELVWRVWKYPLAALGSRVLRDGNCAFSLSPLPLEVSVVSSSTCPGFAAWEGSRDSDPQTLLAIAPLNKPLLSACFCYYLESTRTRSTCVHLIHYSSHCLDSDSNLWRLF